VGVALALRLAGLDRKSVWFDEALGVQAALLPIPHLLDTVGSERNPPLYFLLQHFWVPLHTGDWWLRLPAALAGTAAVAVAAVFARDVLGRAGGALTGLLLAVSPMSIDLSQEARPYGLFSVCASGSLLCLLRATDTRSRRWWVGYVATTVLALYTHNYAVFLLVAEVVFLGFWMATEHRADVWAFGSLIAIGLLFAPWLAHLMGQLSLVQGGFWIDRPDGRVAWDTYQAFLVYTPIDHGLGTNPVLKLERWLVLGLLALALVSVRRGGAVLLPVLSLCVPIILALSVSLSVVPIYVLRYLAFAAGAFWTLVVRGLLNVPLRLAQAVLAGAIVIGVVINLPALYGDPYYSRSDLRSAASLIRSAWQSGDLVVHTREFSAVPFAYYDHDALEEVLLPEADQQALRQAAGGYERVWLVRDFGLLDPTEVEMTAQESLDYLSGFRIQQQFEFPGVHVFLAAST
jgi:mannosyltransferase